MQCFSGGRLASRSHTTVTTALQPSNIIRLQMDTRKLDQSAGTSPLVICRASWTASHFGIQSRRQPMTNRGIWWRQPITNLGGFGGLILESAEDLPGYKGEPERCVRCHGGCRLLKTFRLQGGARDVSDALESAA